MGLRHRIAVQVDNALKPGEVVVAYKKHSRGEIMGIYNSVDEVVKKETPFNNRYCSRCVLDLLNGKTKYTKVLHLQAVVTFRVKKLVDVQAALK
jgi:hypothetical protein